MIKLFRNTRKKLLKEGRTTNYLKYAIGEIVLVVIGILIALSINNWNENQKDRKIEKSVMADLNAEFKHNLKALEISKSEYADTEKAIRILMSLIGTSRENLEKHNIDSLLSKSVDVFNFRPTQNVLTEILASGTLKLLQTDSLKTTLFKWSADLDEKEEGWRTLDDFNQHMFIPYLTDNASMKNIDVYGSIWEEKSPLAVDYFPIFQSLKFENHLDNQAFGVMNYRQILNRLDSTVKQTIRLTDDKTL